MNIKPMKLNSFSALKMAAYPDLSNENGWDKFLTEKGHTRQTFSYLPEDIKLSLRLSFARKNN